MTGRAIPLGRCAQAAAVVAGPQARGGQARGAAPLVPPAPWPGACSTMAGAAALHLRNVDGCKVAVQRMDTQVRKRVLWGSGAAQRKGWCLSRRWWVARCSFPAYMAMPRQDKGHPPACISLHTAAQQMPHHHPTPAYLEQAKQAVEGVVDGHQAPKVAEAKQRPKDGKVAAHGQWGGWCGPVRAG